MRPKYFKLEEFFPESMMHNRKTVLWSLMDDRITWTADRLRERYGKAYINNWAFGGDNHYRGFRRFTDEIGATFSQHKFGRAIDITFDDITAEEIRVDMKSRNHPLAFANITACENTVPWLHVDCRYTDSDHILFFNP